MNNNVVYLHPGTRLARRPQKGPKAPIGVATVLILFGNEDRRNELIELLRESKETSGLNFLGASDFDEARCILSGPHTIYALFLGPTFGISSFENTKRIMELEKIQPQARIVYGESLDKIWSDGFKPEYRKEIVDHLASQISESVIGAVKYFSPIRILKKVENGNVLGLVGDSSATHAYLNRLEAVALVDAPVLIEGETGSGKTEGARWIHRYQHLKLKKKGSLVEVNMAAIPDSLAESQLFGHEKGAFTGATERQQGQFEAANGGTIFLDEIGDCSLSLQKKLLKVIEDKTFTRVGSKTPIRYNAKVICATNRNLREMVKVGTFREDLFYRISTLLIQCPPLQDRKEDIPDLIRQMLPEICQENGWSLTYDDLPTEYIQFLMIYPISGNIRGLKQKLIRFITYAPRDENGKPMLKHWRQNPTLDSDEEGYTSTGSPVTYDQLLRIPLDVVDGSFPGLKPALDAIRERLISSAIKSYGDIAKAATALKIPASTLYGHLRAQKRR